jgi:hypothetical protein
MLQCSKLANPYTNLLYKINKLLTTDQAFFVL